ncbi:MAG TPA: hypothetical protein VFT51_11580 [Bacillales bacterium]|nr:hypothetical protein [Bacillales bacterium]
MHLFVEDEFLIDSKDSRETEKVLTDWAGKHEGRVIYAYEWEGNTHFDDWVAFLGKVIQSDARINLLTKSEVELKQEMKDSVLSYCTTFKENLPPVIERLFGTNPQKESRMLADVFEGLDYLISSASLLHIDTNLEERHQAVVELAQEYESQNFVELADLLKYDWLPWVQEYEAKLQNLYVGM